MQRQPFTRPARLTLLAPLTLLALAALTAGCGSSGGADTVTEVAEAEGRENEGNDEEDEPAPPDDAQLAGTAWQVISLIDGDTASSVPGGVEATVTFDDPGTAIGVKACNSGSAPVEIGESTVDVGPLMMTKMACLGPESDVEAGVVAVLAGEITYEVDGDTLTLVHPSGSGLTLTRT